MVIKGSVCEGVLKAIRSIIRAVDTQSKALDQSSGITGPQLNVLKEIKHENGDIITSVLADKISISQSTATIIIERLVKKNLVERTRDTVDKRRWFISLTNKGESLLKNAPSFAQHKFIELFEKLPKSEQDHVLATLQQVAIMLSVK